MTNLASPQDAWIRLQASILLEDDPDGDVGVLKKKVEDDFLGYMRTLTLSHLEGGSVCSIFAKISPSALRHALKVR